MSRKIKVDDVEIKNITKEFLKALKSAKMDGGKFSFEKTFEVKDKKATVVFTSDAWAKMQTMILTFEKEVAWHGLAERAGNEEDNIYLISDIIVYPQEVTGATVTTDQNEYENWLMSQPDEVFEKIRMQGHSHVRMGTTPSSTDTEGERQILAQLDDDMFYIFMIWNKSFDRNIRIYDMKKNILFESKDVMFDILANNDTVSNFIKEANDKVKERVYSTQVTTYQKKEDEKESNKNTKKASKNVDILDMDDDDDWEEYFKHRRKYGYSYYGYD